MSRSINEVTLVGFLGNQPELKYTPSGKALVNLRLATDESFKDKAGVLQKRTEWHRITVWGAAAESCAKYKDKGHQLMIRGKLQTRSYEKEGQKHFVTEVIAVPGGVTFLGVPAKKEAGASVGEDAQDGAPDDMDVPV